jgi:hypothetical protein
MYRINFIIITLFLLSIFSCKDNEQTSITPSNEEASTNPLKNGVDTAIKTINDQQPIQVNSGRKY